MKKLLLLFLLVAGGVSTVSATKTFYVKNNCGWDQIRVHQWNNSTSNDYYLLISGTVNVTTDKIDNDTYYKVTLDDDTYTKFIIHKNYSGNDDRKTFDLNMSDVEEGAYYYFKYNKTDGPEYYDLAPVSYYTYNFTATTPTEWGGVKIYLFKSDKTSLSGDFPGQPMTKNTTVSYSYSRKSEESSLGLILTNYWAEGYHKSADYNTLPGTYSYSLVDNGSNVVASEVVTTNASGYCTYVNSNPLTISSATAYYATDNGEGNATAHAITNPATSTPMLIKGDASTTYQFAIAASGTDYSSTNAFIAGSGNALASSTDGKYNYILNGDAFYAANGKTVGMNKAYLQLSTETPTGARPLIFEDNETAGIKNLTPALNEGVVYDLQGRRVAQPAKGLYIINGKKVIK